MTHTCKRCGYEAKYKWVLRRHLEKINTCKQVENDSACNLMNDLINDRRECYICSGCNRSYNHLSSLSRHKATCKHALTEQIENKIMARVQDILDKGTHSGHTIHNNNNNTVNNVVTNNTINININKFGIEDRSYIPEQFLTRCLKKRGDGVIELARVTHFHSKHPYNRNVRARNRTSLVKYKILEVYNGDKWAPADCDSVAKQMFEKHYTVLDDHLGNNEDQLKTELGAVVYAAVNQWYDQMRNCDPDKTRDVKDTLKKLKLLILEDSL